MKFKKIRGQARRIRQIRQWIEHHQYLNLETLWLEQRAYVKFQVAPWNRLSLTKSQYPQPEGIYKQLLLEGLISIYHHWYAQLEQLQQPYKLWIWWFEHHVHCSQVVCAIGEKLNFYDHAFEDPKIALPIQTSRHYQENAAQFEQLIWQHRLEIQAYAEDHVGQRSEYGSEQDYLDSLNWFEQQVIQQYHSTTQLGDTRYYMVINDQVWLGQAQK